MAREVPERLKNVRMAGKRTHAQMEELRIAQVNGETEKMRANRVDKINDEHFRKEFGDYKINDYDADSYHVAMEARLFNHQTGAKISHAKVQVFDPATFKQLVANNGFHGYTTFILHDPTVASSSSDNGNIPGVDPKTGKVKTTEAGKPETTSKPVGGQGDPNAGRLGVDLGPDDPNPNKLRDGVGTNDDPNGSLENTTDENSVGPNDPNAVDLTSMNESDAKALYMDLTGKSADGRWSLEKLKEKIAEIRGDVK